MLTRCKNSLQQWLAAVFGSQFKRTVTAETMDHYWQLMMMTPALLPVLY